MAMELHGCLEYYTANRACLFCKLLEEELAHRERLVDTSGPFVVFSAYAARQPYEVWIVPRQHRARFEQLRDNDAEALAEILQRVVERLQAQLAPLSYNLVLHTAPYRECFDNYYHWHFELIPRSTALAGFEWGTGMHINSLSPERAAARLRGTAQL
jgi:UDPglucose--hexose-1-phosphate uridylyltransferase